MRNCLLNQSFQFKLYLFQLMKVLETREWCIYPCLNLDFADFFSFIVTVHCVVFKWFCNVFSNNKLNNCTKNPYIMLKRVQFLNHLGIVNNMIEWVNLIIVPLCVPLFYEFFVSYVLVWSVKKTIKKWYKKMYETRKAWNTIYIFWNMPNGFT